jgi:hypothetical protein
MHAWTLHLEDRSGQPIADAQITVDGGMPAHGHGLPTEPQVTASLGNGDYRVEGLKFNMPGSWRLTFLIVAKGQEDSAILELQL